MKDDSTTAHHDRRDSRDSQRRYVVLVGGYGSDGGFGDWAPPLCPEPITYPDGTTLLVDATDEQANRLVASLNQYFSDDFYATGVHDQYDGKFPYECQPIRLVVPDLGVKAVSCDQAHHVAVTYYQRHRRM